tara:strand:+ start:1857 stop:2600 length:744 start_codon:yes stop_codon:yes gene_type:complete
MPNVAVIIPARQGSQAIKDKNIKKLKNFPLIAYSIAAAKLAGITNIYISTDSKKYKNICEKFGAKVPFLRPKNISNKLSTDYEFVIHFLKWLQSNELVLPDYLIHLRPTTPLRDPKIIIKALKMIKKHKNSTSLRSAHKAKETFEKWFYKNKNNYFVGIKKKTSPDKINSPRQKYKDVFIPNGYIDILKPNFILKNKKLHGNKMLIYETPSCIEVDDIFDFEILKNFLLNKSNLLHKYLIRYKNEKI